MVEQLKYILYVKIKSSNNFMTLAVAKNCKMTKKSVIDDIINTSIMSDMPKNFLHDSNVSRGLYIARFKSIQSI